MNNQLNQHLPSCITNLICDYSRPICKNDKVIKDLTKGLYKVLNDAFKCEEFKNKFRLKIEIEDEIRDDYLQYTLWVLERKTNKIVKGDYRLFEIDLLYNVIEFEKDDFDIIEIDLYERYKIKKIKKLLSKSHYYLNFIIQVFEEILRCDTHQ